MKRFRAISAVVLGCVFTLSTAAAAQQGKSVFTGKGNCFTCHGANAKGTPLGPDLTDGEWLNIDGSLAAMRDVVEKGVPQPKKYPAPMPPMGGAKLNAKEMDAVAAYVFGLRAAAQVPAGLTADRVVGGRPGAPRAAPR